VHVRERGRHLKSVCGMVSYGHDARHGDDDDEGLRR
jgi:hypothetical protein